MQKYKILNKLSSGAFGTVYNAQVLQGDLKGQNVAVKQVYSSDMVKRQLKILGEIKPHENIIKCYEIIEENEYQKNIIMEKGAFDLDQLIQSNEYPIDEIIVKVVAKGVLQGLQHLHKQGFIHRDLKPSNIMVKSSLQTVAICDFGSAVKCTTGQEYIIEGFTRWYKPPQMLFGSRKYKYEVDVWSLGCILAELATGQQIFAGKSQLQQIAIISNFLGDPSPKNWPSITTFHDYGKITFVEKVPKTKLEISKQFGMSLQLTNFIMKMIRYQGRATVDELLKDEYLQIDQKDHKSRLKLGIFSTIKAEPKIIR